MEYIVTDEIGLLHLLAAIISLVTGTLILCMKKGTTIHKKIGYVYGISMMVVCVTSFMIYRLFGGFGIFHWAAVVSGATLAGGMIPVILRKPKNNWLVLHFSFMYWSVIGLYMAFISEIMTRFPLTPSLNKLGIIMGGMGFIAGGFFYFGKHKWGKFKT